MSCKVYDFYDSMLTIYDIIICYGALCAYK